MPVPVPVPAAPGFAIAAAIAMPRGQRRERGGGGGQQLVLSRFFGAAGSGGEQGPARQTVRPGRRRLGLRAPEGRGPGRRGPEGAVVMAAEGPRACLVTCCQPVMSERMATALLQEGVPCVGRAGPSSCNACCSVFALCNTG